MDLVIIAIWSTQLPQTENNPRSYAERKSMLISVFWDKVHILPLIDQWAITHHQRVSYVIDAVSKAYKVRPNHYYAWSEDNASWFRDVADSFCITMHTVSSGVVPIHWTQIRHFMQQGMWDKINEYIPSKQILHLLKNIWQIKDQKIVK